MKMTYSKENKNLDPGNLKATEFKFNRHINLPTASAPEKEALFENRRQQALDMFNKFSDNISTSETKSKTEKSKYKREEYSEGRQSNTEKDNKANTRVDRTCPLEEEIKLLNKFIQKIFQYLYYLILTSSKGQHLEQLWSGHGKSRA